jgi:transposase-like protein
MPRGYPSLTNIQKQQIISRIREKGETVPDLAKEHGVVSKTIYNLLKRQVNSSNTDLELARVTRERDALLQIVGQLVFESKINNKKKNYKNQI